MIYADSMPLGMSQSPTKMLSPLQELVSSIVEERLTLLLICSLQDSRTQYEAKEKREVSKIIQNAN